MAASARRLARAATVAALVAVTTGMPQAESAGQSCVAMRVRDDGGPSTVDRTEYPAVATTKLGRVPYRLNALGYLRSRDLAYGVTPDGHVVTIDRRGRTADLGEPDGRTLAGATAGTISGKVWYVKRGALLSLVDIEPGSVSVRSSVVLRPALLAARVDDFVLVDGLLYGVASEGEVVTIDPDSGEVRTLPGKELPPASAYGSVVGGPDGALYTTANGVLGRSREYRVVVSGGAVTGVSLLASGPAVSGSDAAGCLAPLPTPPPPPPPPPVAPPPPPPPPVVTPPPPAVPPPPPVPAPPPPPVPVVAPAPRPVQRPVPPPPTPSVTPAPPPVPVSHASPPPPRPRPAPTPKKKPEQVADPLKATKVKRDWALTALILILGGSIVARRIAR